MKGGSKTGDPSMNGNFGFVIFESIETAHKVLKSRVSINTFFNLIQKLIYIRTIIYKIFIILPAHYVS